MIRFNRNAYPFSDDALVTAAKNVCRAMSVSLPATDDCSYMFSEQFESKMAAMIKRYSRVRTRRVIRQIAAVILAFLVAAGIYLAIDVDTRASLVDWIRSNYGNRFEYRFFKDSNSRDPDSTPMYRPTWIPDGYVETEDDFNSSVRAITYRNAEGDALFFICSIADDATAHIALNVGSTKAVVIEGYDACLYLPATEDKAKMIVCVGKNNDIAFTINSLESEEAIIQMAKSVVLDN